MQQYIIIAKDGTDANALARRLEYRPAHLALMKSYKEAGTFISGGATLDDSGNMIGSVVHMQFASKEAIDQWIQEEPYIQGGVWERYEILPYRSATIV